MVTYLLARFLFECASLYRSMVRSCDRGDRVRVRFRPEL